VTGDVLTASTANGYLASQVVMVFADAAARTAAITSPEEGMISYLKDTDSTEYYSGAAWVAIGGSSSASFSGCLLTNAANISLANNTTVTLTWDTEVFDVGGYHSTSTNTSRITIPSGKAGKYLVSGLSRYSSNSGGRRIVQITKNGSNAWDFESASPGSTDLGLQGIAIIDLTVGDYVEMTAWQNSGTTLSAQNGSTRYSSFSAYLIGA
jgi:hypothetical protein